MIKKIASFALSCAFLILLVCHSGVAEDMFDSSLASCNKLSDLPTNPPALLQLYQCNVLASVLQPNMKVEQVLAYIKSEHLQPTKVAQTEKDNQALTTISFSSYYRIQLYGDPIEHMDLEITLNEDGETLAAIPLSIDYTCHTIMNESTKVESTSIQSVSADLQEKETYLGQGMDKIHQLIIENPSLTKTLVYEMLQYSLFTSALYPGIPMDDVIKIANQIPLLQATPNADQTDSLTWVKYTQKDNELIWNWCDFYLGEIYFFCRFEDNQLIRAGFLLDYLAVSNVYLPENHPVFQTNVTTGFGGYTFHPEIYVELNDSWIENQNTINVR